MNLDDARKLLSDSQWVRTAPPEEWHRLYLAVREHDIARQFSHAVEATTGPGGGGHPIDIAAPPGFVTAPPDCGTNDQPDG
jgi:hypothetical protein